MRFEHQSTKLQEAFRNVLDYFPIVIPVIGVNGECWVPEVENAFERVGLKLRGHIGGPVFRPPKRDGTMCRRGLLSSECSRFLQLFLDEPASCPEGGPSHDLARIESHLFVMGF